MKSKGVPKHRHKKLYSACGREGKTTRIKP